MGKETQRPFYPDDMALLSLGYGEDTAPILQFVQYIKIKENGQRLKCDLPKGRFYMALNTASLDLKWTQSKVRRVIKKLESMGVITAVTRSTTKGVPSIYQFNAVYFNNGDTNETAYNAGLDDTADTDLSNITQIRLTDTKRDTERDTNETAYNAGSGRISDTERDTESDESKKELEKEYKKPAGRLSRQRVIRLFNELCPNLKPLKQITHWQKPYIDEWNDVDEMKQVFELAGKSTELTKYRNTWANFSWIIKPENRERILAGEFNKPEPKTIEIEFLN